MGHIDHKAQAPATVNCAIITISDSRTEDTDESGRFITSALRDAGHVIRHYSLLKNDTAAIEDTLSGLFTDRELQIIICSGGTGLSRRDITVETVTPMLEKQMPGFGELFRLLTWETIGTPSVMSRALGGVKDGKVILCLPGSLNAVKLATEKIILPEMCHMAREAGR